MVVPSFLINQAEIAKGVKKVEKMFKPDVAYIRHDIGETWIGDPSITFRVLLSDDAAHEMVEGAIKKRAGAHELPDRIEDAIRKQIDPLGKWGLSPHFNYRSVSEQAYLKNKEWE